MSCVLAGWLVLSAALADAPKQAKADEIPSLIERLGSDAFKDRLAAQERLADFGELAREALKKANRTHHDVEVVHRCRVLLRRLGLTAVERRVAKLTGSVADLIEKMGDDFYEVRESAGKELVKIGRPALGQLEAATKHPDLEIRNRAARAIEAIRAGR